MKQLWDEVVKEDIEDEKEQEEQEEGEEHSLVAEEDKTLSQVIFILQFQFQFQCSQCTT